MLLAGISSLTVGLVGLTTFEISSATFGLGGLSALRLPSPFPESFFGISSLISLGILQEDYKSACVWEMNHEMTELTWWNDTS
jgi:uncharacterized membrane protein YuzA (DUF378 family)